MRTKQSFLKHAIKLHQCGMIFWSFIQNNLLQWARSTRWLSIKKCEVSRCFMNEANDEFRTRNNAICYCSTRKRMTVFRNEWGIGITFHSYLDYMLYWHNEPKILTIPVPAQLYSFAYYLDVVLPCSKWQQKIKRDIRWIIIRYQSRTYKLRKRRSKKSKLD